jgi:hypothetical protein
MTMTIESEPTRKWSFSPYGRTERRSDYCCVVWAWHGRGRWRVATRLSDDLDPALRLVDVEHVRGSGQRDQPLPVPAPDPDADPDLLASLR